MRGHVIDAIGHEPRLRACVGDPMHSKGCGAGLPVFHVVSTADKELGHRALAVRTVVVGVE
eukprot:scaffold298898_cov33-Tisochrysis_lutea.AAC.1